MRDIVETDRLTLRPPRASDAGMLALWAGDARVARQVGHIPHPYPPGAAEAFIERARAGKQGERVYAIDGARSETSDFLGLVALGGSDDDAERSFRFWVGPPAWGLGYATEAGAAALAEAFADPALEAVAAQAFRDSAASRAVLDKLRFAEAAETKAFCIARDAMVPATKLRLTRAAAATLPALAAGAAR